MHALEKSYIELTVSYCILSLLDSGALWLARAHDVNTPSQVFFTGTSWKPERGTQEGAWPVLDSSY